MINRDPILAIIRRGIQTVLKHMKTACKVDDLVRLTGLLHNVKFDNEKMYWKMGSSGRYYQNTDLQKHPPQMEWSDVFVQYKCFYLY